MGEGVEKGFLAWTYEVRPSLKDDIPFLQPSP